MRGQTRAQRITFVTLEYELFDGNAMSTKLIFTVQKGFYSERLSIKRQVIARPTLLIQKLEEEIKLLVDDDDADVALVIAELLFRFYIDDQRLYEIAWILPFCHFNYFARK